MLNWFGRYGGYVLILAGALTLSTIVPSAAGPPDVLAGQQSPAPPPGVPAVPGASDGTDASAAPNAALLIGSPRRGLFGLGGERPAPVTTATPADVAVLASTALAPPDAPPDAPPAAAAAPESAPESAAAAEVPVAAPPSVLPPTDRIVIPRIGVNAKVVDVGVLPNGEMETVGYAAGRLAYSAEAGDAGNTVIAGHNDTLGEVFRRLPELKAGDEIVLYRGEQVIRYVVEVRTIVREDGATAAQRGENARWMEPTDEPTCTLITCYPYRVDTHRVIVRAHLAE